MVHVNVDGTIPGTYEEALITISKLLERTPAPTKVGNPAVVGLAGFGLTTMVLQFHNIGWMEGTAPVVWLGLIFGGFAQLVAGLQEYGTGNNFGFSAFTTYGAFWISLGLMLVANKFGFYTATPEEVGWFLLAFTFYTFIMFIGSLGITLALAIVFFLLLMGFVFLDISHFNPELQIFTKIAGWDLMVCALGAWYCMCHVIYKDIFGRDFLPVGTAPLHFLKKKA